jgi:hypothetical protein
MTTIPRCFTLFTHAIYKYFTPTRYAQVRAFSFQQLPSSQAYTPFVSYIQSTYRLFSMPRPTSACSQLAFARHLRSALFLLFWLIFFVGAQITSVSTPLMSRCSNHHCFTAKHSFVFQKERVVSRRDRQTPSFTLYSTTDVLLKSTQRCTFTICICTFTF